MSEVIRLTRQQIAAIVGNDPQAVRAFESLFALASANSSDAGTIAQQLAALQDEVSGLTFADIGGDLDLPTQVSGLLPDANGAYPGPGPTFSALMSSAQALTTGANQLQFDTEDWDSESCFDVGTYRFTPTTAGKYSFVVAGAVNAIRTIKLQLYKNGSLLKSGPEFVLTNSNEGSGFSCVAEANGTTDYFEAWIRVSSNCSATTDSAKTYFQAFLVR